MNVFGEKIRELRRAKGYSLRKLAPRVGVGFTYLSKIEGGKLDFAESPSASLIHRLADVLDADEDELMLLAKRVPPALASRIFDQPDIFLMLTRCDAAALSRIARELLKQDAASATQHPIR